LVAALPAKGVLENRAREFCSQQNQQPDAERERKFVRWADSVLWKWRSQA